MASVFHTALLAGARRGLGCAQCGGTCKDSRSGVGDYYDDYMNAFTENGGGWEAYGDFGSYGGDYGGGYDWSSDQAVNALYDTAMVNYDSPGYDPNQWDSGALDWLAGADAPATDNGWQLDAQGFYYDPESGLHIDEYGNVAYSDFEPVQYTGSDGQQWFYDPLTGINEPYNPAFNEQTTESAINNDGTVDLSTLSATQDYQQQLSNDPGATDAPISLPPILYDAGYILNTPSTTLANDPQAPALPATSPLKKTSTWDKIKAALLKQAQRAATNAASGGASGGSSRPPTMQPNAAGQCPAGYAKNPATGQCQLIRQAATQQTKTVRNPVTGQPMQVPVRNQGLTLRGILSNPLYLLLIGLGLILLAKR